MDFAAPIAAPGIPWQPRRMQPSRGVDLFKVAGIQIAIDYSWLIIFLLVLWSLAAGYFPHEYPGFARGEYWGIAALATLLFFASVLIHELAHSLVANRVGQSVRRITLFLFGGMAHLSREPSNAVAELKIASVGPLTSFALGGAFWLLMTAAERATAGPLWVAMLKYLSFINVALAVFNLLPGFPLDGGRILRGLLWYRSGNLRAATARAADWGSGIALGLMGLGLLQIFGGALVGGLWLIFIGMFLRGAARQSYHGVVVEHVLSSAKVGDLMVRDPSAIPGDLTVHDAIEQHFLLHGFGGFPVTRNGQIEGLVTLGQIKHCPPEERGQRTVRDIMRAADAAVTIPAGASVSDALRKMVEAESGRLLVTDGGRIVGLITRTGITRFIQLKTELEEEQQ
jgi:Zn-dependent protease/predicted transcriptional regulator